MRLAKKNMLRTDTVARAAAAAVVAASLLPQTGLACAACYGQSDAPMAAGMNWGIVSLLGIIVTVLGGIAGCFIALARRSTNLSRDAVEARLLAQAQASWPEVAIQPSAEEALPHPRRGVGRISTLAKQREHCGGHRGSGRLLAPRERL